MRLHRSASLLGLGEIGRPVGHLQMGPDHPSRRPGPIVHARHPLLYLAVYRESALIAIAIIPAPRPLAAAAVLGSRTL